MDEKIKEVFQKLNDENKNVINMVAKGMLVAQENTLKTQEVKVQNG